MKALISLFLLWVMREFLCNDIKWKKEFSLGKNSTKKK